ncbi:hypothetical protein [Streptomyces sp. BE303]|uniref:hypothetical protein n=1 Tax=Streptomyces sp. BE303 TaxID=3002528 RepID=UPI002E77D387|nr:hypothetical protein [Streptomyces sp. BE303]MED7954630.1 hypothetical protein [Streptomyces sp. BE303]
MRSFVVADVPETDDAEAWFTYADVLTAAGDPRGAAIRLEHACDADGGAAGGDRARLAGLYAEVERQLGLDGLRTDGSWRFTWRRGFLDEARFALAEDTGAGRRALVEGLLADHPWVAAVDLTDPECWEGALIDAVLSHPVAHRLRVPELRLTDYHHSAEHSARSLAGAPRPRLEHLSFGYGFEFLYEDGRTSTGGRIDPMDYHGDGLVQTAPWDSLPALRTLELQGAFLLGSILHDGLTRLRVRGPATGDGAYFDLGSTRGVESLVVEAECDVFGGCCPVEQLDELTTAGFPALKHLDLGGSEFDATSFELFSALAESPILPQLESLTLPDLRIGRSDCEGEPLVVLSRWAPSFAHLALGVRGTVDVEGADGPEVDRLFPGIGAGSLAMGTAVEREGD